MPPPGGRGSWASRPQAVAQAHRHVGYVAGDVALWPQLTGIEVLHLLGNLSGNVNEAYRDELLQRWISTRPGASGRCPKATGRRSR